MKKIRIAHMSDFHFGLNSNENRKLNEKINTNLFNSLIEIIKMCNQSKVDVLLIAGDFIETSMSNIDLYNNLVEILSTFAGEIIISPGNHDYISLNSVYNNIWPKNVHIFKTEEIRYYEFKNLNLRVYGNAFTKSHILKRILANMPKLDEKYINIGVFHGQVDSSLNVYSPIFLEDIKNSNLDYLALGHIHKRSDIQKLGKTYYAYSGNPVGRGFDETGEKGIYLGDVSKEYCSLNFYKISSQKFIVKNIMIDDLENHKEIFEKIDFELHKDYGVNYKKNYYRIILKGYKTKDVAINLEILKNFFSEFYYVEIKDDTRVKIDVLSLIDEETLRGKFVKNALLLEEKLTKEDLDKILEYGIRAFEDML